MEPFERLDLSIQKKYSAVRAANVIGFRRRKQKKNEWLSLSIQNEQKNLLLFEQLSKELEDLKS